jgi:hypothetical protein
VTYLDSELTSENMNFKTEIRQCEKRDSNPQFQCSRDRRHYGPSRQIKFGCCIGIYVNTLIHEKIKSRLNSGNACYHSVQNLLSSRLLYKNVNIK